MRSRKTFRCCHKREPSGNRVSTRKYALLGENKVVGSCVDNFDSRFISLLVLNVIVLSLVRGKKVSHGVTEAQR